MTKEFSVFEYHLSNSPSLNCSLMFDVLMSKLILLSRHKDAGRGVLGGMCWGRMLKKEYHVPKEHYALNVAAFFHSKTHVLLKKVL